MELIILSIVVVSNFILLKWKLENGRLADLFTDLVVLLSLSYMFSGTMGGMIIALTAGFIMSIYLWVYPPDFSNPKLRKSLMALVPKFMKKTIYV